MVRKRGLVQVIDRDPSRMELPQRCLPVLLLNGRQVAGSPTDFESRLRRMTMLEEVRRSTVRDILVLSDDDDPLPPDLKDLWSSGFRTNITVVSNAARASESLKTWAKQFGNVVLTLASSSIDFAIPDLLTRYEVTYPEQRRVIRVRNASGAFRNIDVTELDEPERPILGCYSLIEERDLRVVTQTELTEKEFVSFFQDPAASWRPYAAGLPWIRDPQCPKKLGQYLRRLDSEGADENCIVCISSESGARGTTLARSLAYLCARDGYPVLLAKQLPFAPDALPVANFLNRVRQSIAASASDRALRAEQAQADGEGDLSTRLYEVPWVIVFDTIHTQYRESEISQFSRELKKAGRPTCLIVVTGPFAGAPLFDTSAFRRLIDLNHAIELEESRQLGRHLNTFLRTFGKERAQWQWDRFYEEHTV